MPSIARKQGSIAHADSRRRRTLAALIVGGLLGVTSAGHAAGTPEQQCQAGKNKTAADYADCRGTAEAKLATSGDAMKYNETLTKCLTKFLVGWYKLESKAVALGTTCPSIADQTALEARIADHTDRVAVLVGGNRFVDNGDGTVTDRLTGLQWEKKTTAVGSGVNLADPHDVDNAYTWSTTFGDTAPNGTAFMDFLDKLNGGLGSNTCFVNHCDWRLPTLQELLTLHLEPDPCGSNPCIDAIFGPTASAYYWSSTTDAFSPVNAWHVNFFGANFNNDGKSILSRARAVRTLF